LDVDVDVDDFLHDRVNMKMIRMGEEKEDEM
jgi:hypothetical protein